jgi:hypothetical protein
MAMDVCAIAKKIVAIDPALAKGGYTVKASTRASRHTLKIVGGSILLRNLNFMV